MDENDEKIIGELKKDSSRSLRQISKATGIPLSTVHARIRHLERTGVIKGYTVVLDNSKLGKDVVAYVSISADYPVMKAKKISQTDVVKMLKKHPLVESAATVTGETDIIIKVRTSSLKELDEFTVGFLRQVEGVLRTVTMVVLHEA